jgi:hypothetical protein
MNRIQKIKWFIVRKFFKDVMDFQARKYLTYNANPSEGIQELYLVAKVRITREIKEKIHAGNVSSTIFDSLFDFYTDLLIYDYNSLIIGIAREIYDDIKEHEIAHPNQLVNKEKLYFLFALLNTTSGNTITATTYWELTIKERHRVSGTIVGLNQIINQMPTNFTSLITATRLRHDQNLLINKLRPQYAFINDYNNTLNYLNGLSQLSYLSLGLRNVHVNILFDHYQHRADVIKMYGQELINNLSVLNETELKKNTNIQALIPLANDRMIGGMLQKISQFNPGVHAILGNPFREKSGAFNKSGLYVITRLDLSGANFNNNYINLITDIESGNLTDDELKAYILYGFHHLRNNVLHNLNSGLIYYNDIDLFLKTIGLLFAGINVIRSL